MDDPRWKWSVFSGLTRREQWVLVFLIGVIGAGLAYQQYQGSWRSEPLTLHRTPADAVRAAPSQAITASPVRGRRPAGTTATVTFPLDINSASAEELEALPGVGPVRAQAIVRYRQARGPFRGFEDIKRIPGIGDKTAEAWRPYLKPFQSPTSAPAATPPRPAGPLQTPIAANADRPPNASIININLAGAEELCELDGIGPALARRIVEYRQRHGPFRTPGEIQKVRGIGPSVYERNRDRISVEKK